MGDSKKLGENPQNGSFIMENPIKMDDLVVPLFLETPKWPKIHVFFTGCFFTPYKWSIFWNPASSSLVKGALPVGIISLSVTFCRMVYSNWLDGFLRVLSEGKVLWDLFSLGLPGYRSNTW